MLLSTNLKFSYPGSLDVFSFPDINCPDGEHTLILGQSGRGKTTFLHLLAGLLIPTGGDVQINSQKFSGLNAKGMDRFRGQNIGLIFQRPHFLKALTVRENLLLAQKLAGLKPNESRVKALLGRLGIGGKVSKKTSHLSLGEQQRVAIARALLNKPAIILADEPTSSLDDHHCGVVLELLLHEAKIEGASLIIVTHDQRLKERFGQRVEL